MAQTNLDSTSTITNRSLLEFPIIGSIVGLFGSLLLFRSLLKVDSANVLWADDFDPNLLRWIAEWGYYALFQLHSLTSFWNANSFYPHPLSLAYSDSLITLQLAYSPLRLLGLAPLNALYCSFALFFIVGCTLSGYFLAKLGFVNRYESALILFAAHFSLPVINFFNHYQLFAFSLVPSFLLCIALCIRDIKPNYLVVATLLFCLIVGFATYFGPILFTVSLFVAVPLFLIQIKRFGLLDIFRRFGFIGISSSACLLALLYFVQLAPYFSSTKDAPPQSFQETVTYSATPSSLLFDRSIYSYIHGPSNYSQYGDWERSYFPGYLLLLLPLVFILGSCCRTSCNVKSDSYRPIFSSASLEPAFALSMALLFLVALVLSWGPYFKEIKLPFYYLADVIPGLRNVRAPGRLGMLLGLPLGYFTIAGLRMVAQRYQKWAITIFIIVSTGIAIESFPTFKLTLIDNSSTELYKKVAPYILPGTPIVNLPVSAGDHMGNIRTIMRQLNGSTEHWGKLVVGYGAKTTDTYMELLSLDASLQGGSSTAAAIFSFMERLHIPLLLVEKNRYQPAITTQIEQAVQQAPAFQILLNDEDVLVAAKR